jgi:hypothetical protein
VGVVLCFEFVSLELGGFHLFAHFEQFQVLSLYLRVHLNDPCAFLLDFYGLGGHSKHYLSNRFKQFHEFGVFFIQL